MERYVYVISEVNSPESKHCGVFLTREEVEFALW